MSGLREWINENVASKEVRALGHRMATEFERLDGAIARTDAERQNLAEWRDELRKGMGLPPDSEGEN